MAQVFAFQAALETYSPVTGASESTVVRTIAIRDDQTLEQLHQALRLAFGYPMLVDAEGVPPPQYPEPDEDG